MNADRYLKVILTIIAIELGWLAITHSAQPVAAQAARTVTPVVITGIELRNQSEYLPVGVLGGYSRIPAGVPLTQLRTTIDSDRPIRVDLPPVPLDVRVLGPVTVEPGTRPIKFESVPYTPAQRPGE